MAEPIAALETAGSRSGAGCRAWGSRSLRLLAGLAAMMGLLPAGIAQQSSNTHIVARYLGAFDNAAAARSPGSGEARPDLEQANPSASVATFNPAAVGISPASAQTLTLSFYLTGYGADFTPTVALHYGLSYSAGAVTCKPSDNNESCTVPITFQPLYPGGRRDALFLMDGTTRLATVLLYGVGQGPLALVQPASLVNTYYSSGSGNNSYFFQSVTDENGTVWSISSNQNTLTSLTTAGVFTNIPYTQLLTSGVASIAMDGAGVIYISYANGSNSFVTYDTVQGISGTFQLPGTERFQIVGVGNTGNVYAVDNNYENYYQTLDTIAPSGAVTMTDLALSSTGQPDNPEGIAVDSAENLFFGGYSTMNEYSNTFVQSTINTNNDKAGIAVDAADSLYAGAYGGAYLVQLAPSNYAAPAYQFSGGEYGVSLGPDGTVNAAEYFNLVQYDRSQGAISFATNYGDPTPPAQDTGIYNGGNEPLTISNIAQSGSPVFTVQAVAGNGCTDGMVLAPGTACEVAITFTSPHPGSFTGALTFTTNSLNQASSAQSVALSATTRGVYAVASPYYLTFSNQIVNTTSAVQMVTVTNEGYPNDIGVNVPGLATGGIFSAGVGTCGPQLAVGASCQFPVTFSPLSVQTYSGSFTLVIASNLILPVSGTSIAAPTPLTINEVIHISDGIPAVVAATPLQINEVLHISDGTPAAVPATPLLINEVLHVSNGIPAVISATPLQIHEVLHISDGTPAVVPATPLLINEVIHVADGVPGVIPATPLQINEVLHISDGIPEVTSATPLPVNEVLHISDGTPTVEPATPLQINEVLHISDGMPAVVQATPLLINEMIHVSDTPGPIYPVVVAAVVETIHVTDTPTVGLLVVAAVVETIHVTDTPTVGLPVVAAVVESIHVTDTPAVGLPVVAAVVETIHVTDTSAVGLPVFAAVVETIHVTDTPAVGLPVVAAVVETIHVSDTPAIGLPVVAAVVETIHVADSPTVGLPVVAVVVETVHVTDTPTVGLPVVAAVVETIHVTDTPAVGLPVVAAVVEAIHITDTPAVGMPVVAAVVETVHVTDMPAAALPVIAAVVETIQVTDTPVVTSMTLSNSGPVPTQTVLTSSANPSIARQTVTFTATVSSASHTAGIPQGTVQFSVNGTQVSAAVPVNSGWQAQYATAALANGQNSITATYSGSSSFITSTSAPLVQSVLDFNFTPSAVSSQTILPGQIAKFVFTVAPQGTFANPITFSVSSLPPGATASFDPQTVTPSSSPTTVVLTIETAKAIASARPARPFPLAPSLLLGILAPLFGIRRLRRTLGRRTLHLAALVSLGIAAAISGCGGGYFDQAPQTYPITVTATSGALQHSVTVTLTVE
jgi:hypothetical protein